MTCALESHAQASTSNGEISAIPTASTITSCQANPSGALMLARLPLWFTMHDAMTPRLPSALQITSSPSTTSVRARSTSETAHSPRTKPCPAASKQKVRPRMDRLPEALPWRRECGPRVNIQLEHSAAGMGSHLPARDKLLDANCTATSEEAPSTSKLMQGPFRPCVKETRPQPTLPPEPQTPLPKTCFSAMPHSEGGGFAKYTPTLLLMSDETL
mmetsp:Transcript_35060/g.98443  ORF Transcript_35060/g.98443 Transcript_35060/m.98443 type:complete len:215 (-) Transcript_35060:1217-1861(-)